MTKLYTIGFTKKTARHFFELLLSHNVKTLIDTRINNSSQLSGFAKGKDLEFFLGALGPIKYLHELNFAPTREILVSYRKKELNWDEYARKYLDLLDARRVKETISTQDLEHSCLLCSEHLPTNCHRRLLAEYIRKVIPSTEIVHLK